MTSEAAPLLGDNTNGSSSSSSINNNTAATTATKTANDDYNIISLIRRDSTNKNNTANNNNNNNKYQKRTTAIPMYTTALKGGDDGDDDQESLANFDDTGEDSDAVHQHQTTYSQTVIHLVKGYIGCGILSLPWAVSQLGIPLGLCGIIIMSLWSSYNCWTVVKLKRYIGLNELAGAGATIGLTKPSNIISSSNNDTHSEDGLSSHHGSTAAQSMASSSNMTYADVGEWAHGGDFQHYVAACICTQQLAICTVFMSFVGENLYAVLSFLNVSALQNHQAVISAVLPAMMALSFLPSLKSLAPVMLAGTVLILAGFSSLGVIGALEWGDRPDWDDLPTLNPIKSPMALCGILYSFEGICIILPVESAMREPKHFKSAFCISMVVVTILLCSMAGLSILAFGEVTNGSITAFLLEEYKHDDQMKFWLMMSNLLVSVSIILSYPLQLFPAIELMAPVSQEWYRSQRKWWRKLLGLKIDTEDDDDTSEHDLEGFEPMAEIPEHEIASLGSLPSQTQYHEYGTGIDSNTGGGGGTAENGGEVVDNASLSRLSSMGNLSVEEMTPAHLMQGDSPALRAALVLSTYLVAMVVPNVESLVSLAGAVAGSSTALLIPPILELAWIRHMEKDGTPALPDWEGGPSIASKTTLVVEQQQTSIGGSRSPLPRRLYPIPPSLNHKRKKSFLKQKLLSWFMLVMGLIFAAFGSYFSVQDIVKSFINS